MISDILSLAPWWFWVFIAPELILTAGWLVVALPAMAVAVVIDARDRRREAR